MRTAVTATTTGRCFSGLGLVLAQQADPAARSSDGGPSLRAHPSRFRRPRRPSAQRIKPGRNGESGVTQRMVALALARMPPLGEQVDDTAGVALIQRWIVTEWQNDLPQTTGRDAMKRITLNTRSSRAPLPPPRLVVPARAQVAQLNDKVARGKYLVATSGCHDCHTPWMMGPNGPEPDMTRALSGHPQDLVMPPPPKLHGPWIWAAATTPPRRALGRELHANLTPDTETGLGNWTGRKFIETMRTGRHMGRDGRSCRRCRCRCTATGPTPISTPCTAICGPCRRSTTVCLSRCPQLSTWR